MPIAGWTRRRIKLVGEDLGMPVLLRRCHCPECDALVGVSHVPVKVHVSFLEGDPVGAEEFGLLHLLCGREDFKSHIHKCLINVLPNIPF